MTLTAESEAFSKARDLALAARVPDSDRDGPGRDPVTVTGWYACPTVSGRPAWTHYRWVSGRCIQGACTYDIAAEDAASAAWITHCETERDLDEARPDDQGQGHLGVAGEVPKPKPGWYVDVVETVTETVVKTFGPLLACACEEMEKKHPR